MTNMQAPVSDRQRDPGRPPRRPRNRLLSAPVLALPVAFVAVLVVGPFVRTEVPAPAPAAAPAPADPAAVQQGGQQAPGGQPSDRSEIAVPPTTIRVEIPDGPTTRLPGQSIGTVTLATRGSDREALQQVRDFQKTGEVEVPGLMGRQVCIAAGRAPSKIDVNGDPAIWGGSDGPDGYRCSKPVPAGTTRMTIRPEKAS